MSESFQDELISIDAIYGCGTLLRTDSHDLVAILTLPARPSISIRIGFPSDYPEHCPYVLGPDSTRADVAKGEGQRLAQTIEGVLQEIWTPGEPCIFALIEETTARLTVDSASEPLPEVSNMSESGDEHSQNMDNRGMDSTAVIPDWVLSDVRTEKKSVFVARTTSVFSPAQAKAHVTHLLDTDRKVARATHNITAWRIKGDNGVQYQDCDDDGETAAGSRLLHLLELVDAWDVMVVVTRWYGGVHLGPDRFRLINQVAREALAEAGFVDTGSKKKGKK